MSGPPFWLWIKRAPKQSNYSSGCLWARLSFRFIGFSKKGGGVKPFYNIPMYSVKYWINCNCGNLKLESGQKQLYFSYDTIFSSLFGIVE